MKYLVPIQCGKNIKRPFCIVRPLRSCGKSSSSWPTANQARGHPHAAPYFEGSRFACASAGTSVSRFVFYALLLVYMGYLILGEKYNLDHALQEEGMLFLAWSLVAFLMALVVQTILHELGHWIAGRLSGYQFSSIRFGPFKWQKQNGRLRFHLVSAPATLGQCLMIPPQRKTASAPVVTDGMDHPEAEADSPSFSARPRKSGKPAASYPYLLYNLGGILANGLAAGLSLIWFLTLPPYSLAGSFAFALMIAGLILAFANGIPAKSGVVFNDGTNIQELIQHPMARQGFWVQLMGAVYSDQNQGPVQYPEEWFDPGLLQDVSSPVCTSGILLYIERLQALGQYDHLQRYLQQLPYRSSSSRMPKEDQDLLDLERLFLLTILGKPEEAHDWMHHIRLDAIQDRLKGHPALYRTMWCISALENQPLQARTAWIEFETVLHLYKRAHPNKMQLEMRLFQDAARILDPSQTFQQAMFHPSPPAV